MQTKQKCVVTAPETHDLTLLVIVRNKAFDQHFDRCDTRIIAYGELKRENPPRLIMGVRFALRRIKL